MLDNRLNQTLGAMVEVEHQVHYETCLLINTVITDFTQTFLIQLIPNLPVPKMVNIMTS